MSTNSNKHIVALFGNSYDKTPMTITLEDVMKLVVEDKILERLTNQRRRLMADAVIEENVALKAEIIRQADSAKLNTKTISVAFQMAGGKTKACCTTPTWLTLFELDFHEGAISEDERTRIMDLLRADEHLLLHHESISGGGGSHNIVSYTVPDDVAELMCSNRDYAEKIYKRVFKRVNDYYASLTGAEPDYNCNNINRTLVLAHDTNAFFNPEAQPFAFTKEDLSLNDDCTIQKQKPGPKVKNMSGANDTTQTIVSYIHDVLAKSGCRFESHNHNNYVFRFTNLLNDFGIAPTVAENIVAELFAGKMTDDPVDIMTRIYNSDAGQKSHGSILTRKGRVSNNVMAEHLATTLAQYRVNTITRQLEIKYNDFSAEENPYQWEVFEDRHFNTLYSRVIKMGASINHGEFRSMLLSEDVSPDFDPVEEYTSKLTPWDPSQPDYIGDVIDHLYFKDKANEAALKLRLRKWILQLVAHIIGVESEHQYVASLVGPQNVGKSHFWKHFLPTELSCYFDTIDVDELKHKDGMIKMTINLLLFLDELELTRAASSSFKAATSKPVVNLRVPYGRFVENRKRRASFCAACNDIEYIGEREGNRRLVSMQIEGSMNTDEHPLNIDGMFAQAIYLIKNGYEYNYTRDEVADISAYNEQFLVSNLTESGIIRLYRKCAKGEPGATTINTADIISDFKKVGYYDSSVSAESIGRAMSHLGFLKERKTHGMVYYVIYLPLQTNK